MPAQDNEDRYEDILKRIAQRPHFGEKRQKRQAPSPHAQALELLNAFDAFAALTQRDYEHIICYGPKLLRAAAWAGVALWYQRKGYHGYRTLRLLGLWAHYQDSAMMLSLGQRQLPYRAPIYDAGIYRVAIQSDFRLYYEDAGGPPTAGAALLYQAPYKPEERLRQRRALQEILRDWAEGIDAA